MNDRMERMEGFLSHHVKEMREIGMFNSQIGENQILMVIPFVSR